MEETPTPGVTDLCLVLALHLHLHFVLFTPRPGAVVDLDLLAAHSLGPDHWTLLLAALRLPGFDQWEGLVLLPFQVPLIRK